MTSTALRSRRMGLANTLLIHARELARHAEGRWFDWTHHVQTCGNVSLEEAGIPPERAALSGRYVPARAANIRAALRFLAAATDLSDYTFIDLGSGKGRALFIAAEFPFHRVVGVEFSPLLHGIACRNAASFRYQNRRADRITTLAQDAATFAFPGGPLVLYMFHPFGTTTMQSVIDHLAESLRSAPRHLSVILINPVLGDLLHEIPSMHLVEANRRYHIYEARCPEP